MLCLPAKVEALVTNWSSKENRGAGNSSGIARAEPVEGEFASNSPNGYGRVKSDNGTVVLVSLKSVSMVLCVGVAKHSTPMSGVLGLNFDDCKGGAVPTGIFYTIPDWLVIIRANLRQRIKSRHNRAGLQHAKRVHDLWERTRSQQRFWMIYDIDDERQVEVRNI